MVEKAGANAKPTPSPETEAQSRFIVVDIGKNQSKKAIRRLRQGRGKLLPKIEASVKTVQEETGATKVLPIVIVVRARRPRLWRRSLW